MRHDDLAADLARKLEKAKAAEAACLISREGTPPGPTTTIWKGPDSPESREWHLAEMLLEDALKDAAPLLLSERAALRAVEKIGRLVPLLGHENLDVFKDQMSRALSALDRAREGA